MRPDAGAILFDLDDTLYPMRRFERSGFAAVAAHIERTRNLDAVRSLRILMDASAGPRRGQELQALVDACWLPHDTVAELVEVMRAHRPAISLPEVSRDTLCDLRTKGWRLGIVTNGLPAVQRRKIAVLGVEPLVDTVIYAAEHGGGSGKPDPAPFDAALSALGVFPNDAVFVGDDERCDVSGAKRMGLRAVRFTGWAGWTGSSDADAVISSLGELAGVLESFGQKGVATHAA